MAYIIFALLVFFVVFVLYYIFVVGYNDTSDIYDVGLHVGDILVERENDDPFRSRRSVLIREVRRGGDGKLWVRYSHNYSGRAGFYDSDWTDKASTITRLYERTTKE